MEIVNNNESEQNLSELASWNQQRSTEQLLGFIARREAAIADYQSDL